MTHKASLSNIHSWLKRNGIKPPLRIFSDPDLTWMTTYKVVGESDRWSMAMIAFDTKGTIFRFERDIDPSHAFQMVVNTTQSIENI